MSLLQGGSFLDGLEGFDAPIVATQEATDKDSNVLRGKTAHESAVAIRKPAGAGNGYRLRDRRIGGVRIAPP